MQVGGGLDAVIAMTDQKDLYYSKSDEDDQKHFSEMIMSHIRNKMQPEIESKIDFENETSMKNFKTN